jgi:hypothetical protein
MHWKIKTLALAAAISIAGFAQSQEDLEKPRMPLPPPEAMHPGAMGLRTEIDVPQIKGAPFCATVSTEHTQQFADGNRIHTTNNATLCRDSEGRTRRESELDLMGTVAQSSPHKLVTITDPVAGVRYMLDSNDKTAHKVRMPAVPPDSKLEIDIHKGAPVEDTFVYAQPGPATTEHVFVRKLEGPGPESDRATENLGDQVIGGIHATGTRVTTTIPAGKMGNEQPIQVTSESWYSPDLKVTVMTKHNDPWAGEMKTQFINVNPSEPDHSMFTVPSDYKVVDDKGPIILKLSSLKTDNQQ